MNKAIEEVFNYLDEKIEDIHECVSGSFMKTELLLALNRQTEAIEVVEKLSKKIDRKIAYYEASRFMFWRGLYEHSLIFINLVLEDYKGDEMCLKHREEILSKVQKRYR
ncbi:MAG: hypothetical protein HQK50_07150 [Oligoflexia bacterium]|nr:hypothetical protein [Oligoflexia bacterium]MBF0365330.1 hypothetical protein [Oligoflexia bacterium]